MHRLFLVCLFFMAAKINAADPPLKWQCPKVDDLVKLSKLAKGTPIKAGGHVFFIHAVSGKIDLQVVDQLKGPAKLTSQRSMRHLHLPYNHMACIYKRKVLGRMIGALILRPEFVLTSKT